MLRWSQTKGDWVQIKLPNVLINSRSLNDLSFQQWFTNNDGYTRTLLLVRERVLVNAGFLFRYFIYLFQVGNTLGGFHLIFNCAELHVQVINFIGIKCSIGNCYSCCTHNNNEIKYTFLQVWIKMNYEFLTSSIITKISQKSNIMISFSHNYYPRFFLLQILMSPWLWYNNTPKFMAWLYIFYFIHLIFL